jgi:hypothetical protein
VGGLLAGHGVTRKVFNELFKPEIVCARSLRSGP